MMTLDERLDKAEETIQKPSFRENKGLGNEVGYYIFDYPAEKELYIRERIDYIKKKSENSNDDYKVVVFDLYDIMIDIIEKKGYLEKCYQFEKTKGFERVSKSISNMLRITSSDSLIVNYIKDNTPDKAVVFITGIGKCYPIIRSHTILMFELSTCIVFSVYMKKKLSVCRKLSTIATITRKFPTLQSGRKSSRNRLRKPKTMMLKSPIWLFLVSTSTLMMA